MATARSLKWQDAGAMREGEGNRYGPLLAWALLAAVIGALTLLTVGTAYAPPTVEDVSQLTQAP